MKRAGIDGISIRNKIKSRSLSYGILMLFLLWLLRLYRSSYRAVSSTSTAVDASAFVDDERCSLCNSFYRAIGCTQSASDALVSDLISHSVSSFLQEIISTA